MLPLGIQIRLISCSFREILAKSYVGTPLLSWWTSWGKSWMRLCGYHLKWHDSDKLKLVCSLNSLWLQSVHIFYLLTLRRNQSFFRSISFYIPPLSIIGYQQTYLKEVSKFGCIDSGNGNKFGREKSLQHGRTKNTKCFG